MDFYVLFLYNEKEVIISFCMSKIRRRGCSVCSICKRPVCGNAFLPFFLILLCSPLRPYCLPGGCPPRWAMTGTAKPSPTAISAMARNTGSNCTSPKPNTKNCRKTMKELSTAKKNFFRARYMSAD